MLKWKTFAGAALALALIAATLSGAQQQPPPGPQASPKGSAPVPQGRQLKGNKRQSCWKQLGISPSVKQKRKSIHQSTRAQIQGVCTDSSLAPQQKREKIREIHQSSKQQMAALLPPDQLEALRQCQHERGEGRHPGGTRGLGHGHSGDPCSQLK